MVGMDAGNYVLLTSCVSHFSQSVKRTNTRLRDTFCGNFVSKSLKLQSQLHIYSELIYKSEVAGDCQFNLSAKYCARRTSSGGFIISQWQESFTSPATDRPASTSLFIHFTTKQDQAKRIIKNLSRNIDIGSLTF